MTPLDFKTETDSQQLQGEFPLRKFDNESWWKFDQIETEL
jgi:hypothetical protein